MHVIVVGCGRVGSGLARALTGAGHSVCIIDKSEGSFRRLPEGWPGDRIVGFGFDRDHLAAAGAENAAALAAVTNGDNSNILTARIARETFEIPNVVARIYDPRRAEIYQRLGIPTVATVTWTTDQVLRRLFPQTTTMEWSDPTGQLELVEHLLPHEWAGRRLADFDRPGQFILAAMSRSGRSAPPSTDLVGQEGDLLFFMVTRESLPELRGLLGIAPGTDTGAPQIRTDPVYDDALDPSTGHAGDAAREGPER